MRRNWAINHINGKSRWDIYKLGVVVDLTISQWGARAKLRPEDLGLDSVPDLVRLGHKRLMKKQHLAKINTIITKASNYLINHSFSFPFGAVRFVPQIMAEEVTTRMNEFKKEYLEAVDELVTNYEHYRTEMFQEWATAFVDLVHELDRVGRSVDVVKLTRALHEKYPTAEQLRYKFGFDFVVFEIAPPNMKSDPQDVVNVELAKKITDRLDGFLDDVVARLQSMVIETTNNIKDRLEKGKLGGNTINSFVKFANSFRKMDIIGLDVEAELESLRDKLVSSDKEGLKVKDFVAELQNNLSAIQAKVLDADVINGRMKRTVERPEWPEDFREAQEN